MANEQPSLPLRSAASGGVLLGASALLARSRSVSPGERRVFERLNTSFGRAERPIWAVMQFGNGLTAVAAPVTLLAIGRSRSDAVRAGAAAFGGWQLAKAVKRAIPRGRPAAMLDDVVLRDGDPDGGGFVSGHATVAMATAITVGSMFGHKVRLATAGSAVVVAIARVHVGAHLPLDVVGGAGLGLVWGSLCAAVARPGRNGSDS